MASLRALVVSASLAFALLVTGAMANAGPIEDCDRMAGEPAVALADIPPEAEGGAPDALQGFVADAGSGPADLTRAVSQRITILPIGAALRSPSDVLALGRASLPDAARLLRAAIMRADPLAETRLAACRMTAASAGDLAALLTAQTAPRRGSLRDALAEAAATPGLEPGVAGMIEQLAAQWNAALADGQAEAAALVRDMADAGLNLEPGGPDGLAGTLTGQDRYAVELREGGGWQAWDPVTGEVFDPGACAAYATMHDLPAGLAPSLHVVMTATEGAEGEVPADRVVLDQTLPFDQSVVLAFGEAWSMLPPDATRHPGGQAYTPVLLRDGAGHFGQTIVLPRAPSYPDDLGETIGDVLGGVLDEPDAAGEAPVGDEEPAPVPDGLRRLVVDIGLSGFGAPEEIQHLVLVDRDDLSRPLPDFGANHLDLMTLVTMLPLDGSARAKVAISATTGTDFSAGALAQQLTNAGLAMNGFEPLRQAIFADLSPASPPLPQGVGMLLTTWTLQPPETDGAGPGLRLRQQMLRPAEPVGPGEGDPAAVAAAWGVGSVLAERLSLQMAEPATGAAPSAAADAVAVWAAARAAGGAATPVRSARELAGLSSAARARGEALLDAGQVLLSPLADPRAEDEPRLAWWVVSTEGAQIEDLFADGGRASAPEEGKSLVSVACRSFASYFSFGSKIQKIATVAALVLVVTGTQGDAAKAVVKYAQAVAKAEEERQKAKRAAELASKACSGGSQ